MGTDLAAVFLLAAETLRQPLIPLWAMELIASVFLYAWLFCLGATVGSFLNVVVYRLPRGKNLAYPGSYCPHCGHPIRLADNIPILSWLALGGRCRDCRGPISPRYFLVELGVAAVFLAVALIETKLTGTFPRRNWDARSWLVLPYDTLPFWATYGLHVAVLMTLLGAALIDSDGFPTPRLIVAPAIVAALVLPAVSPVIHTPSALAEAIGERHLAALAERLLGLAMGVVCGLLIVPAWARLSRCGWPRFAPISLLAMVGAAVGPLRILEISALSAILFAVFQIGCRRTSLGFVPFAAAVLAATIPRLLELDQRLIQPLDWPKQYEGIVALASIFVVALASGIAARFVSSDYSSIRPIEPVPDPPSPADNVSPSETPPPL